MSDEFNNNSRDHLSQFCGPEMSDATGAPPCRGQLFGYQLARGSDRDRAEPALVARRSLLIARAYSGGMCLKAIDRLLRKRGLAPPARIWKRNPRPSSILERKTSDARKLEVTPGAISANAKPRSGEPSGSLADVLDGPLIRKVAYRRPLSHDRPAVERQADAVRGALDGRPDLILLGNHEELGPGQDRRDATPAKRAVGGAQGGDERLRAVAYCRAQRAASDALLSLGRQRDGALQLVAARRDLIHVGTYEELGGAGAGLDRRPVLLRLLDDVSAGEIDVVIVEDAARLSRNSRDFKRITAVMAERGVRLIEAGSGQELLFLRSAEAFGHTDREQWAD